MKRLCIATAAAFLLSCSEPPKPHSRPKEPPRAKSREPKARTKPATTSSARLAPPPTPKGPGPLPQSDQEVGRRAAVYTLLTGGDMAKNLPEKATDEGTSFDPNLAESMPFTRPGSRGSRTSAAPAAPER